MTRTSALISALSILSLATPAFAKDDGKKVQWESISNEDGVESFRQEVPGSPIVAFKGVTTADVPIGKLLAVFKDPAQRKHWVDRYVEHKTFQQTPEGETYWIHFYAPVVSDRDFVLKAEGKANIEKRTYTVHIKSIELKQKGEDDCCVRAEVYKTYYEFVALPNGKTKLLVEVHMDPKGLLPNWLINMIQKSWPRKTLNGLIKHSKEAKIAPLPDFADWHTKYEAKPAAPAEPTKTATTAAQ